MSGPLASFPAEPRADSQITLYEGGLDIRIPVRPAVDGDDDIPDGIGLRLDLNLLRGYYGGEFIHLHFRISQLVRQLFLCSGEEQMRDNGKKQGRSRTFHSRFGCRYIHWVDGAPRQHSSNKDQ